MIANDKQYIEVLNLLKGEKRLYTSTGKLNSAFLRRSSFTSSELCKEIKDQTKFLSEDATISERIYCIEHQINQRTTCVCGSELTFITNTVGYLKSCSKCFRKVSTNWKSSSDTVTLNIRKERNDLLTYIQDVNSLEASYDEVVAFIDIKSKSVAESVKWVLRSDYRENAHILKKIVNLTQYMTLTSVNYNWANRMYNIAHNTHEGKVCEVCKSAKTRFVNFIRGYNTCCSNKKCVQEFGCKNRVANHIESITPLIEKQGFDLMVCDGYRGLNHEKANLKCRECNTVLNYDISNGTWKNIRCHVCNGESGVSFEEKTVLAFVKQLTTDVNNNCRIFDDSHKELDMYIPHKNLAIEYNGALWHSFGNTFPNNVSQMRKHKNKHYLKHKLCTEHGIKLLQINSYEWLNNHKRTIWESIISNNLGMSVKLHARKCEIVELTSKESNNFLNDNHLQGMCNSKVKLGLRFNNQLVSVMTFSKPRFSKKYQWELVRFCNVLNHTVVGGASKLLKYFTTKYMPQSLISYADVRYSDGSLYKSLGFDFVKHTTPSYIYIKGDKILSRFSAQKHRLKNLVDHFDADQTELQNMMKAGYRKMWDAGTMLFTYNLNTTGIKV